VFESCGVALVLLVICDPTGSMKGGLSSNLILIFFLHEHHPPKWIIMMLKVYLEM
jgi:hypothetical protein